jgi:murein DD-endopeptidase MepM/ murein hydrolase activator NlpD
MPAFATILAMRTLAGRASLLRSMVLAVLTILAWSASYVMVPPSAGYATEPKDCSSGGGNPADEKKLKAAAAERQEIQEELHKLFDTREELRAEIEATRAERKQLNRMLRDYDRQAGAAEAELIARVRRSYMMSSSDPVLVMLSATDASDAVEQSRVLGVLARGSSAYLERAANAVERTDAAAEAAAKTAGYLKQIQGRFDEVEQKTQDVLAKAEETEARLSAKVAMQRAANGSGCPLPLGQVAGGLACPVDQPRSYSDTYGAPRSGGRVHMGVDILGPIGTPIRAYENGTITRMSSNSLGGITLYLVGDSGGNQYYHAHLSGYASGISPGDEVEAGQHIGYVGDTGNAAGIPHLHWEVQPGGGANANPYPYALQACG